MPLEFRRQRNGTIRDVWFGAFELNGKRYGINLGVKIAGTPPASLSLKDDGDTAYEKSRTAALAKLDHFIEEARKKNHAEHLVEKLYEIKTGEAIKSVKLTALGEEWGKIARRRKPNARYASQCVSTLTRFAGFVRQANPKANELAHVTRTVARSFMDAEAKRGVTGKTWNDTLKLLRATFKYLLPAGGINPFADMPTKETDTVFRQPFTPDELAAITDAARADEFIRPIIIVGMCSAMRRGDCCLLDWKDVDLPKRFITVKTSKTGQTVSIPIFPMLYDELNARSKELGGKRQGFVFPEQAKMYLENPDGITWRVKKVLTTALGQGAEDGGQRTELLPEVTEAEARKRGEGFIAKLPEGDKRARMVTVFKSYMDGKKLCEVVDATELSKGSVSNYLNEIEKGAGCRIVRGRQAGQGMAARLRADSGLLRVLRDGGKRRASVRDFHSFRVTWVTLALTARVPLELVQKVTGHKTTDIVLKHYFQPGREAFRQALQAAMPKLLMNGKGPEDGVQMTEVGKREQMRKIVERGTAKTWKQDKARLLELIKAA